MECMSHLWAQRKHWAMWGEEERHGGERYSSREAKCSPETGPQRAPGQPENNFSNPKASICYCSWPREPPRDKGPRPIRPGGRKSPQDAADCPSSQQHPVSNMQDLGPHINPQPAKLQHLHPVSQQGLQPMWVQPQPSPHPGLGSSS